MKLSKPRATEKHHWVSRRYLVVGRGHDRGQPAGLAGVQEQVHRVVFLDQLVQRVHVPQGLLFLVWPDRVARHLDLEDHALGLDRRVHSYQRLGGALGLVFARLEVLEVVQTLADRVRWRDAAVVCERDVANAPADQVSGHRLLPR